MLDLTKPAVGGDTDAAALAWHLTASSAAAATAVPTGRLGRLASVEFNLTGNKVKQSDVVWLMDKLATTQAAGLPMFRALGMLANMRKGSVLGTRLATMQQRMSEGIGFAAALAEHRRDFGPLVCALVAAGEAAGSLDQALSRAAQLTETRLRLRRKIRSALTYPISVIVITTSLIAALLLFVVPQFAGIYAQAGGQLPALTRGIIAASHVAPWLFGALLTATGVAFAVVRHGRRDPHVGMLVDRIKLRIPVLGSMIDKGVNARIAATIANLLAAGVPLLEALEYASAVAGNRVYATALDGVREAIGDGATFSAALQRARVFPEMLVQLAAVGEESGALPALMERYSANAEEEVSDAADAMTSMLEPLMMAVIGGVVGTFLVGLYLPIIQLGNQIK